MRFLSLCFLSRLFSRPTARLRERVSFCVCDCHAGATRKEEGPVQPTVQRNEGSGGSYMFCAECGAEINDKAVVCPKCGVPVAGKMVAAATNVAVPNHMVGAILTTVFCCLIGGIIAIVYASQVNTKLAQGDIAGAQAASKTANGWIIANIVFGLLGGLIYVIMVCVGAAL